MKRVLFTILMLAFADGAIAASPTIYPRVFDFQQAQIAGGEHGYIYYHGSDTLAPVDFTDTLIIAGTRFDTARVRWFQIGPLMAGSGTYPNKTLSDSLFIAGGRQWFLWVQVDTLHPAAAHANFNCDSVGLENTYWYCAMTYADTVVANRGWLADSTNQMSKSGNYSLNKYGDWLYEPISGTSKYAIADIPIKRWKVYNVRAPACPLLGVRWDAVNTVKEATIVNWYLVGAY